MPRTLIMLGITILLGGCAAQPAPRQARQAPATAPSLAQNESMALVMDPPITRGLPPVDLSRDERRAAAFGGYRGLVTTWFDIQTDDRQTSDWSDRYERRTMMDQSGVSYR